MQLADEALRAKAAGRQGVWKQEAQCIQGHRRRAAACDLEYIGAHWNRNPLGVFVPKDLIHGVRCDSVVFSV